MPPALFRRRCDARSLPAPDGEGDNGRVFPPCSVVPAVFRHRRPSRASAFWLWMALAAALLMTVAPVVSRDLQATAASHDGQGAVQSGHGQVHPNHADHAHHGNAPVAGHVMPSPLPAGDDPHAAHGAACEYCLIAARALLLVATLLLALLPCRVQHVAVVARSFTLPRWMWPAHPPRGPPRLA